MNRPWDILELAEGDALRQGTTTRDGARVVPIRPRKRAAVGERTVRRIPTEREQRDVAWQATDPWTRKLIKELMRLGHDAPIVGEDGRVYLTGVGRGSMILVLTGDLDADGLTVQRVTFGRESWTARQATLWLRKRAAR